VLWQLRVFNHARQAVAPLVFWNRSMDFHALG
jgi:hypothetical protein